MLIGAREYERTKMSIYLRSRSFMYGCLACSPICAVHSRVRMWDVEYGYVCHVEVAWRSPLCHEEHVVRLWQLLAPARRAIGRSSAV